MLLRRVFTRGLVPLAVALLPALAAAAEDTTVTYLAPGVNVEKITDSTRFYDVGKGALYWYSHLSTTEELYNFTSDFSFMGTLGERYVHQKEFNPNAFKDLVGDQLTSWYNAGSNAIQYWQDCYGPFFKRWEQRRNLPQGLTYDKNNLEALAGTQSLHVNMAFYDCWPDVGGLPSNAFEWYLSGNDGPRGGFFREYYDGIETCKECSVYASQGVVDMKQASEGIFESFGLKQQADGTLQPVEQGLIPTLSVTNNSSVNVLTCYGFTLGEGGLVNSLYIANPDDVQYRIEHIYLKVVETEGFQRLLMFEDEACTKNWHGDGNFKWGLTDIYHINTPDRLKELYGKYHDKDRPMAWTGESSYWSTDTTLGWDVEIDGETYTSGYENGRPVQFTDAAYEFKIYVQGEVEASSMTVVNDDYDYKFTLEKVGDILKPGTLKIDTLDKSGKGELRFINVPLTVNKWKVGEGSVIIEGTSVTLTDATIDGTLAIVGEGCKLTLDCDISGSGTIVLGDKVLLDFGGHTLSGSLALEGSAADENDRIGDGTILGDLILGDGVSYTWSNDNLHLMGNVALGNSATFDFCGRTLSHSVILQGSGATIKNGTILGDLILADGASYTWNEDTERQIKGNVTLGDRAKFDLGGETFTKTITMKGSATIGHGTYEGALTVAGGKRLTLLADTTITGGVTLEDGAGLDMGGNTFHLGDPSSNQVTLEGSATIGNGKLEGSLTVAGGQYLALLADTTITGGVTMQDGATFDMGGNTFHLDGDAANKVALGKKITIGNGTLEGALTVEMNESLTLLANTTITGGVTLENGAAFDMGGNSFHVDGAAANRVVLGHNITIGNGKLDVDVTIQEKNLLHLNGDLFGSGTITLKDKAVLDLGGHALSHSVSISQSNISEIHNGTLNGDVTVGKRTTLRLNGTISGEGTISLGDKAVLDLVGCTGLSNSVSLDDSEAYIRGNVNGFNSQVTVGGEKELWLQDNLSGTGAISLGANAKLHLSGHTYSGSVEMSDGALVSLDSNTAIIAREGEGHAVLEKVSVSAGMIAGTDSSASLVDGVYIDHEGYNLTLKDLTLTDNNSILVGENKTITLNQVTIKPSKEHFDRENPQDGVYYFDMTDLFHCSVEMEGVTFDASDLSLPEGFNPKTDGIAFDLGDARLPLESMGRDITLLLGGYGSQTMGMDEQGNPVFRNLVRIPEPATGTLGLLALASLSLRRRRK